MDNDNPLKEKLTIGRLARAAGVGVPTVRYYQRRGLMREPARPSSGSFRHYGKQDVEQLLLIKHAKELGFTLAEIGKLMSHVKKENCQAVRSLAEKKLESVTTQIRVLNAQGKALKGMLKECSRDCSNSCQLYKKFMKAA